MFEKKPEHTSLITKTACVETITSPTNDLECFSENAIYFMTPDIHVRNVSMKDYINQILFGDNLPVKKIDASHTIVKKLINERNYALQEKIDKPVKMDNLIDKTEKMDNLINKPEKIDKPNKPVKIDMTNLGELEGLSDLEVESVTSSNSYKLNPINEKYDHPLNLVSTHTLNIKSQKIYVVDERSEHKTKPQLFQDYLYNLVNEKNNKNIIPNKYFYIEEEKKKDGELFDITEMGEYFTNTIHTERITTTNLLCKSQPVLNDFNVSCKQPALIVSSNTIVNFNSKDILFNGAHIDDLIKASLDETNMFKIKMIISTNKNPISATFNLKYYMDMDGFQNSKYEDIFTYDIKFTIYCRPIYCRKTSDFNYVKLDNIEINMIGIKQNMHSDNKMYTFENLDTRYEYELRASIKNTFTHTEFDYGIVQTNIIVNDENYKTQVIITPAIYNDYSHNSESVMSYEKKITFQDLEIS
jgi:hypothetical protein